MAVAPATLEYYIWTRITFWLSTIFSLVKSRTLVYAFALAALGTFFIASGVKIPDFSILVRLISSVYFLALATYLYNDLTDYNIDKVNKRTNVVSSNKIQYNQILYPTIGFFVFSVLVAFSINEQSGIGALVFTGLAIAYSHPRSHLKDMFVIKTVVTAAGGFIASLMGALAVEHLSYLSLSSSLIMFLMYFINGPLNDINDIQGDRNGGRRTIPIVVGVERSFMIIMVAIFSIVSILVTNYYFFGVNILGISIGLIICGYLIMRILKLKKQYENKKKVNQTRTSVRVGIFAIQISIFLGLAMNTLEILK